MSAGTTATSTVTITDDDVPSVTVSFGAASYTVTEGASRTVTVTLDADPERTVVIPMEKTNQDGATTADYSGVPSTVTFNTGETSKTFDFEATQDEIDDDGEGVKLGFGTMPDARVRPGTTDELTLSIDDDDTAAIVLSPTGLTVGEGDTSSYTVKLATQPTATVTVTISGYVGTDLTLSGTTLTNDALTFTTTSWDTAQTVTVVAGPRPRLRQRHRLPDPHRRRRGIRRSGKPAAGDGYREHRHHHRRRPHCDGAVHPERLHRRRGRDPAGDGHPQRRPGAHGDHPSHGDRPGHRHLRRLLRAVQRDLQRQRHVADDHLQRHQGLQSTTTTRACCSPSEPCRQG